MHQLYRYELWVKFPTYRPSFVGHESCPALAPGLCSEANLAQSSCEANAKLLSGAVTSRAALSCHGHAAY